MSDWTAEPGTASAQPSTDAPPAAPDHPAERPGGETAPDGAGPSAEPAAPAPLGVVRTPTGNAEVDAALERLADADHLAADGHTAVYEDVHRGLRSTLTALDAGPAPAPPYDNRS
ncbi:hypothetical protein OG233_25175 [Streptomyces sp. NBC_01218]|uniref:hypothetical protein n=1 Tax=unclassified Streptomyces TaxID=2593676 RepID=UPI0023B8C82C|nr:MULTISPECIES: hypothetical protein [unclassified Streptomyces]WEH42552.1 hypothetical protein PZB77_25335 [Streptomyces sp. AM 2-1-1]WSQ54175.1 hypothetical protein OG233_25175 [Streptomyces sp. NBC_01218]